MDNEIRVELHDVMGNDRSIAEAAWTSSLDLQKKQTRSDEDVKRIVNMLADLKHSVPFESIVFRFWIKMPIVTDRQFMTHRLQSANGLSGRYRTMPLEWLHVPKDIEEICSKQLDKTLTNNLDEYEKLCKTVNQFYQSSLKDLKSAEKSGIITNDEYKRTREFLRGVLPQNNLTERVSIMNLRSFSNFVKLRLNKNAQPEIQQVAKLMLEEVKKKNICPIALEALERNNWII